MNLPIPRRVDGACALTLFVVSAALAFWTDSQFRQSGLRAGFYQEEFAPARLVVAAGGSLLVVARAPSDF